MTLHIYIPQQKKKVSLEVQKNAGSHLFIRGLAHLKLF